MLLRIVFFAIVMTLVAGAESIFAQRQQTEIRNNLPDASERPEKTYSSGDPLLENLMKMRIRAEEKEHAEFVERGAEVARLTEQINQSFSQTGAVMREFEKLTQLEKVVKKIRKSLGGSDDDKKDDSTEIPESNPATIAEAVTKLAEIGANLSESVKTSSRYTVSADSINNANELLELIYFIRRAPR
ncbi:MAG: hypothetical protein M3209_05465 [Acidobacteriota bacterium]|nr:hypothetical protein [Acidobacteriota bacterium]